MKYRCCSRGLNNANKPRVEREEEEDGVSEYYWRGDGNCYSRKVRRPS